MNANEFVSKILEMAVARGVDAGPFVPHDDTTAFYDLEVYEHPGDDGHRVPGVYVMCGRRYAPDLVEPTTFVDAIARVELLPLDLETVDVPNTRRWPGAHCLVWMAIMDAGWPVESDRPMPWTLPHGQALNPKKRVSDGMWF